MLRFCLLLGAIATAVAPAAADSITTGIYHEAGRILIATPNYRLAFSADGIIHASNLLTGELYTFAEPEIKAAGFTGVESLSAQRWSPTAATFTVESPDPLTARITQKAGAASLVTTVTVDKENWDTTIRQEFSDGEPGLIGCKWALDRLNLGACSIIVPAMTGVEADLSTTATRHDLKYPGDWEAQLAIVQGKHGGLAVWAEDSTFRFKRLHYNRSGERAALAFLTEEDAPFGELTTAKSVTWRINTYKGNWREPAGRYRTWMNGAFGLVPLETVPGWLPNVRSVITIHGRAFNTGLLDDLAERIDPNKTVLYVANWRADDYDVNYPDYTPMTGFGDFVKAAQALGFRVMLHVDIYGASPANPDFDKLGPYQIHMGRTGDPAGWMWHGDESVPYRFAFINPAAEAFRDLFVERMAGVYKELRPDALHLDVSHEIINDAAGKVDGKRLPQGAVELHRKLEQKLPGVVLGGEGMHELLIASRERMGQCMKRDSGLRPHPISSFLFSPYAYYYGHLSYLNPDRDSASYGAYKKEYVWRGVLPTLALDASVNEITHAMEGTRRVLREARAWQSLDLRPDFDSAWRGGHVFRYKGSEGASVDVEMTSAGMKMAGRQAGLVWEMISGGWSMRTSGSVPGWPAYDGRSIFGFPTWAAQFVSETPPDLTQPHISDMSKGLVITRGQVSPQGYEFHIDTEASDVDLVATAASAAAGVIINDVELPLQKGAVFEPRSVTVGGMTEPGLFAVMPWHPKEEGQQDYPWGQVYMDLFVDVPHRGPRLLFDYGIGDAADPRTDGAMFTVTVDNTETVFQEMATKGSWRSANVDLSKWSGKLVRLRLLVDPGPARSVSYDLACWGKPRIVTSKGLFGAFEVLIHSPKAVQRWYAYPEGAAEPVRESPGRGGEGVLYRFTVVPPLTLGMVAAEPADVSYPVDLSTTKAQVGTVSNQVWSDVRMYDAGSTREETIGGVKKRVIAAHPPGHGRTVLQWNLRLPRGQGATLSTSAGIGEKSMTGGAIFVIRADGKPLYSWFSSTPSWSPIAVDLSDFAGRDVWLSLETDSAGDPFYDWALWGDPVISSP